MYVDPATGKLTDKSLIGHLASGVPGSVAGMAAALERYGSMPLAKVMEPAIRLARDGFIVDSSLFRSLRGNRAVMQFAGNALFYPNGAPIAPGTRLVQSDLARTLEIIAAKGPAGFYEGPVAEALVAEMKRGGGIITMEDLKRYRPEWRAPIRSTYRGYTLLTMPPASSGGITMTETLNILENFAPLPRYGSAAYTHLLTEAFRRAFIDRNEKLGDPAFVKVPLDQLTSKTYAKELASGIDREHATKTPAFKVAAEPEHTTHYSTADAHGNVVATTTTLNGGYGSGVWIPKGGFFMNNEMDDFAAQPGSPNMFGLVQGDANAIVPGKRMLSAMSPTVVLDRDGKVLLVVGAAGGPRIITTTTQVILNVIEHHMSLADAMRAPRIHHQSLPDTLRYEAGAFSAAAADSLQRMGHAIQRTGGLANANAIIRANGGWIGVREPRSTGARSATDATAVAAPKCPTGSARQLPRGPRDVTAPTTRLRRALDRQGLRQRNIHAPTLRQAAVPVRRAGGNGATRSRANGGANDGGLGLLAKQLAGNRAHGRTGGDLLGLIARRLRTHRLEFADARRPDHVIRVVADRHRDRSEREFDAFLAVLAAHRLRHLEHHRGSSGHGHPIRAVRNGGDGGRNLVAHLVRVRANASTSSDAERRTRGDHSGGRGGRLRRGRRRRSRSRRFRGR
ncbi:MAG: gamma-glutamyltransferase, partial [Gemmatimonadaceae bacterium]|nr:gamma-glutamyltransferase [Gemmatimonadaceae bacterium]